MTLNGKTLGNNELGAWRVFSLFMLLLQKGPLPSSELYTAVYSDLSTDSALRTFSRDRAILKQLGFEITEIKTGKEKSFYLSESNFFESSRDLSDEDANQLLVICSAILTDATFVYQKELRNALSKIVGNFYSSDSDESDNQKPSAFSQSKVFPILYESLSSKQLVKITYTNSQNQIKQRHLGVLDFFVSQGLLYFVAKDFSHNVKTARIKTFRVNRVIDAAILKNESFSIPVDLTQKTTIFSISSSEHRLVLLLRLSLKTYSLLLNISHKARATLSSSLMALCGPLFMLMKTLHFLGFLLMD